VIAFGRGASAETICGLEAERPTGVLFEAQTPEAIIAAVARFEAAETSIAARSCRENALRFSPVAFRRQFGDFVAAAYDEFIAEHATSRAQ